MIQRRVLISGRVQGVGFRAATLRAVHEMSSELKGYVRNLDDGKVEAVFLGPLRYVLEAVSWCEKGPPSARVERLEVLEEAVDETLSTFTVLK